jgi:hypothetical protein
MYAAAANRADQKFRHIESNSRRTQPDPTPTVLTENEINAYLATHQTELPKGVSKVRFTGSPGDITTDALVDFDQVTARAESSNPLLSLFTGTHDVQVVSHAWGRNGTGQVHIDSVSIGGIPVPHIALQYFVDKYIKPKHPNYGLDSRFRLPDRIATATVGVHQLTVVQK